MQELDEHLFSNDKLKNMFSYSVISLKDNLSIKGSLIESEINTLKKEKDGGGISET